MVTNFAITGLLGLEATKESLRWLWESRFAAVASDSPSFERAPSMGPFNDPDVTLHQWLLAGWGMPIGEMFDLEKLSEECKKLNRWTFMVSSMPIHVSVSSFVFRSKPKSTYGIKLIAYRYLVVLQPRRMLLLYCREEEIVSWSNQNKTTKAMEWLFHTCIR
jgi:hypothetical protein